MKPRKLRGDPIRCPAHVAAASTAGRGRDPEALSAARELALLLEEAIDALPDAFRTVYLLREVEGLDTSDAARCLGIGRITVKTRLHRARRFLRARLPRDAIAKAQQAFGFAGARCDRLVDAVLSRLVPPATRLGGAMRSQPT